MKFEFEEPTITEHKFEILIDRLEKMKLYETADCVRDIMFKWQKQDLPFPFGITYEDYRCLVQFERHVEMTDELDFAPESIQMIMEGY